MNRNLLLSKDPVFEIHASLSHHRLDVPLHDMTLGFEYENNNIIIYFTVKKLILLLQKTCDLFITVGFASHGAKTKASQEKVLFLVINVCVIFALTCP